jgi:uncharacterized membrane protein (UPF0127 family)
MKLLLVVPVIGILFGAAAAEPVSLLTESKPSSIQIVVAKTHRSVIFSGEVTGPRPGQKLFFRLRQEDENGELQVVARERVIVEASSVDDSIRYRVALSRPSTGDCDVRIRFAGNAQHSSVTATKLFPCLNPTFGKGTAILDDGSFSTTIDALIAADDNLRAYGLMYRQRLRTDKGMVFSWPTDTTGGFYMKNTLIPLSIAFFDSEGIVLEIFDMEPCLEESCPTYAPSQSYRGALEVNQGMFEEWGIEAGDRITIHR